ncbi:hypothetical protein [Paraburkholderia sp. BR10882]|uniref:hypothetical protein n=1 Tax=unclassified Paraburkholderia TaxID=2615204 RepID=UPI0034CD21D5
MILGEFKKLLALCGYPGQTNTNAQSGGGGVGVKAIGLLAASGATVAPSAIGYNIVLASIPVPANTLNANGALRVYFKFSCTNNADEKDISVYFGGQQVWSSGVNSGGMYEAAIVIQNTNSMHAQSTTRSYASFTTGFNSNSYNASTVDTTQAQTLQLECNLPTAIDAFQLNGYTVEVMNP